MTNIAMENGTFIDGLHGYTYKQWWFSMAMLNNQRVIATHESWLEVDSAIYIDYIVVPPVR